MNLHHFSERLALTTEIGVISSGRGENLRHIIEATFSGFLPAKVKIVLADQEDAGALKIAHEYGVPAYFVDPSGLSRAEYDEIIMGFLDEANVDLVVLTGYMRILSPPFVQHYKNCIINRGVDSRIPYQSDLLQVKHNAPSEYLASVRSSR